jgi:hypothetical protein
VIIWGDDIGYWNVSAYNQGMIGLKTNVLVRAAPIGCAVQCNLRAPGVASLRSSLSR